MIQALVAYRKGIHVVRALAAEEDSHLEHLAELLHNYSYTLSAMGNHGEALGAITEAVEIFRAAGDQDALAEALNNLADTLTDLGRRDEAIVTAREAVDLSCPPDKAVALATLARAIGTQERAEALSYLANAVQIADGDEDLLEIVLSVKNEIEGSLLWNDAVLGRSMPPKRD